MQLGSYLQFQHFGVQALLGGLLLLAMGLKVLSTLCGLLNRAKPFLPPRLERLNWWISKLSALSLCAAALGLCFLARDKLGLLVFGSLGVLALAAVLILASRRVL